MIISIIYNNIQILSC